MTYVAHTGSASAVAKPRRKLRWPWSSGAWPVSEMATHDPDPEFWSKRGSQDSDATARADMLAGLQRQLEQAHDNLRSYERGTRAVRLLDYMERHQADILADFLAVDGVTQVLRR